MNTTTSRCSSDLSTRCALSVLLLACSAPTHAFQFDAGAVAGSFDTTISYGAAWRAEEPDQELIGISNGGSARTVNGDDGNLNFDKRDLISSIVKVTHDLELKHQNVGAFVRGAYFYDGVYKHLDADVDFVNGFNGFGPDGQDRMASDAQLLDAYIHGTFDIAGRQTNARLGRQVVNWGESTFIGNGINVINPVDVARLRVPGAELKEGLLPLPMIWLSQEVSQAVTVEAFYLGNFERTKIDARGSFFSNNDFLSDDGDRAYFGFGRRNDQHFPLPPATSNPLLPTGNLDQIWVSRGPTRDPDDRGQYGVALRLYLPELNDTEFGIYYIRYHSRTPIFSGIAGTPASVFTSPVFTDTGRYFAEYPDNIRLLGLSFNTSGPFGIALQGEYSYRPNQPLQIAGIEVLFTTLSPTPGIGPLTVPNQVTATAVPAGTEVSGYRRIEMHQLQLGGTKAFGPTFGASQFAVVGEIGYNRFNLPDDINFSGPGTDLPAPGTNAALSGGSTQPNGEGYLTENSWGYRVVGVLTYNNVIGAVNVLPRIAFAHDVNGVGPNFNQGVRAVTLGLGFGYREQWAADLAYTSFFGGRTFDGTQPIPPTGAQAAAGQTADFAVSANPLKDRDFIAATVSYSF